MDTIVQGAPDDGAQDLSLVDTEWTSVSTDLGNNNAGGYVYIAIKMDQQTGLATQQEVFSDFDTHVSPLDPNMSSVARYSPVYNEPTNDFSPIVFVTQDNGNQVQPELCNILNPQSHLETMPTVLCNNDIREVNNQYLELVGDPTQTNTIVNASGVDNLQLVPEGEQAVELLITDQETGISYSVSTQELLVERCLEDPQLLETLAPDDALLDHAGNLTLKDEDLNEEILRVSQVDATVNNYINSLAFGDIVKNEEELGYVKMETRRNGKTDLDDEEQLLSCVYSISDKPILSRARASLPASFLVISIINEENAVFAKKVIPKSSQFGPLEGLYVHVKSDEVVKVDNNILQLFVKLDDGVYKVDFSDENSSNWMGFVRKAQNFEEQNLLVSEDNGSLYFITTKPILPKQELKVGYSNAYAQQFNLPILEPKQEFWNCYECTEIFTNHEDLQKHLDVHDNKAKDENVEPKKLKKKSKIKKHNSSAVECNLCGDIQFNYIGLKKHLSETHQVTSPKSVEESFSIITNYECDVCHIGFKSEALLKIHQLQHDADSSEEQANHVCPACQRKFPTQRQLVNHVKQHALPQAAANPVTYKCSICCKPFSTKERLQKHMIAHAANENKPIKCDYCPKRFLNNSALSCHVKTHYHGTKMFECPICKESFDHVLKLKLHVPLHCENNQYTCPYCKKTFKQYSVIRKHIRAFHCDKKYSCTECDATFMNQDKLKLHKLKHSNHREFLCAGCGKQFKRKDKLTEHIKKVHSEERENSTPSPTEEVKKETKKKSKCEPTDFHRFIYKCHTCMVGFKRRGMLVNHLAKRHPDIPPDSVPELNLPILQTTRIYYCQYCEKFYKSSSKRKVHILKNHPGEELPMSNRKQNSLQVSSLPNPTYSQTVGSKTTTPQNCEWCHKQYASKAKLLQHKAKKHQDMLGNDGSDVKTEATKENVDVNDTPVVTEEELVNLITNTIDGYNIEDDSQYLSINENCGSFIESGELETSSLYRLSTTSNGLLPPR
ncbi:unnamed protein product [Brassicogethes aeneus]|uniref:C2H2-type domain-containing protein n=1 Tax=Brassicogethes aeneus TaxID=1431903 RepID=A0A9P0FFT9_BRAAE|nr:unnamed protein product [Brassicogethes aeneus]